MANPFKIGDIVRRNQTCHIKGIEKGATYTVVGIPSGSWINLDILPERKLMNMFFSLVSRPDTDCIVDTIDE